MSLFVYACVCVHIHTEITKNPDGIPIAPNASTILPLIFLGAISPTYTGITMNRILLESTVKNHNKLISVW